MKTYARMVDGQAVEIIPPLAADQDIFKPGEPLEDGSAGEPVLDIPKGAEIPIERRFHPDVVATLVEWPASKPLPQPELPAHAVPASVTMRQARLALFGVGKLAAVDIAIAGMSSPQKDVAKIEWEYAATVDRDSGLIVALATALGLDDAALDALFSSAAAL